MNLATGDFFESETDISFLGAGLPFGFTRTYDAQAAQAEIQAEDTAGPLGFGWTDNLDWTLTSDGATGGHHHPGKRGGGPL